MDLIENAIDLLVKKIKSTATNSVFVKDGEEVVTHYLITGFKIDNICEAVKKEIRNEN
jgi:hypothetical protein